MMEKYDDKRIINFADTVVLAGKTKATCVHNLWLHPRRPPLNPK